MLNIFLMIFNYFHDLAVAFLATNILVIYFLGKYLDEHQIKATIIPHIFQRLARFTNGALVFIILGGAVRAYFFKDFEWHPAIQKGQINALIIKHLILFAVTIIGIVIQVKYLRKYGKKKS